MDIQQLIEGILLFGPGFLFWKIAYLSGAQHRRLQWEWIVWSVLAGFPIAGVVTLGRSLVAPYVTIGESAAVVEVAVRFVIAAVLGYIAGQFWMGAKRSENRLLRRTVRNIRDSAWDYVLDEASKTDRAGQRVYGVQFSLDNDGLRESYYGALAAFGYERADVERWIYLEKVHRWRDGEGYVASDDTSGLLVHADHLFRLRLIPWPPKPGKVPPFDDRDEPNPPDVGESPRASVTQL